MSNIQAKVEVFVKLHEMESPAESRVLDLVSEVGELAKDVLKMSDYGRKDFVKADAKDELGDVFFSLINVANYFGVNLEEAVNASMDKYSKRIEKGSADSENE